MTSWQWTSHRSQILGLKQPQKSIQDPEAQIVKGLTKQQGDHRLLRCCLLTNLVSLKLHGTHGIYLPIFKRTCHCFRLTTALHVDNDHHVARTLPVATRQRRASIAKTTSSESIFVCSMVLWRLKLPLNLSAPDTTGTEADDFATDT